MLIGAAVPLLTGAAVVRAARQPQQNGAHGKNEGPASLQGSGGGPSHGPRRSAGAAQGENVRVPRGSFPC